jgi:hypothetical protein
MEPRQQEAAKLAAHKENELEPPVNERVLPEEQADPRVIESLEHFPNLRPQVEGNHSILNEIKKGYFKDPLCSKILENVGHHKKFKIMDNLLYTYNHIGESVLCIPLIIQKKQRLTEVIIAQAHEVLGHLGPQKTVEYI